MTAHRWSIGAHRARVKPAWISSRGGLLMAVERRW
jgi:hypothetical protein